MTIHFFLYLYLMQVTATSNMLWDQYMSTSAPINSTTKNPSWEKLAGGKVIMLLPYTTVGEKSADEGTETQTPFYHPTKASLQRFIDEDHPLLSILPANIDYLYNRTSHFASSSDIQMIFKSIPSTFGYEEYVNQIQESCDGKQSGSFDVVWLDANAAGKLGHCMVNLWNWNADIVQNQDPHILANNIHNKRLVGLPLESSTGIFYFNSDIFQRNMMDQKFTTMAEFEELVQQIVISERKITSNYDLVGLSMSMNADEAFMSLFTEVLASTNYSSLFNTLSNDTTIASNATVNAIQRLLAWVDAGIIEVPQLGEDGNQIPFTSKFITGNAVYLRHWSTWNPIVSFGLGFTPISFITKDTASLDKKGMGVNNGWSLGVYKYSSNQDASVKMIKFMTSKEYQRNSILSSAHPIQPTYPDLLLESGVCHVYGDLCATLQNTITINRPAVITGIHYNRVSQLIANNITALIRDPKTMVASLNYLDGQVNALLGFKVLNGTEILDFSKGVQGMIKKIPTKMGVQFSILMIFMGLCVGGIFYYKKRTENVNRETLDSEIIGFVKSERKEREMDQIEV